MGRSRIAAVVATALALGLSAPAARAASITLDGATAIELPASGLVAGGMFELIVSAEGDLLTVRDDAGAIDDPERQAVSQYNLDIVFDTAAFELLDATQLAAQDLGGGDAGRFPFQIDPLSDTGTPGQRRGVALSPLDELRIDLGATLPADDPRTGFFALKFGVLDPIVGATIEVGILDDRANFVSAFGGGDVFSDAAADVKVAQLALVPEPGPPLLLLLAGALALVRRRRARH